MTKTASCDKKCELQNSVNRWIFKCKWRSRVLPGACCLSVGFYWTHMNFIDCAVLRCHGVLYIIHYRHVPWRAAALDVQRLKIIFSYTHNTRHKSLKQEPFVLNFLQISYIPSWHLRSHLHLPLSFRNVEPGVFSSSETTVIPKSTLGKGKITQVFQDLWRVLQISIIRDVVGPCWNSERRLIKSWPHIRQGYPLNLDILIRRGTETNKDSLSNGKWSGNGSDLKSPTLVSASCSCKKHYLSGSVVPKLLGTVCHRGWQPRLWLSRQITMCFLRVGLFGNAARYGKLRLTWDR